jgi:hypothetical protein
VEAPAPKQTLTPTLVRLEPVVWLDLQKVPFIIFGLFLGRNPLLLALHVAGSGRGSLPRKDPKTRMGTLWGSYQTTGSKRCLVIVVYIFRPVEPKARLPKRIGRPAACSAYLSLV